MNSRLVMAISLLTIVVGACGDGSRSTGKAPPAASAWREPPVLSAARRSGGRLVISGTAAPGARVVLIAPTGPAFASAAGADGRFDLHLDVPSQPQLFRAEVQSGAAASAAPGFLLVTPGPAGLAVVLAPGEAARVLDGGGLISAADYDGRTLLVTGRARPGASVTVTVSRAQDQATAVADARGDYRAVFPTLPPGDIRIDARDGDRRVARGFTLAAPTGDELSVAPNGDGLSIQWPLAGGGAQATWIAARPQA